MDLLIAKIYAAETVEELTSAVLDAIKMARDCGVLYKHSKQIEEARDKMFESIKG